LVFLPFLLSCCPVIPFPKGEREKRERISPHPAPLLKGREGKRAKGGKSAVEKVAMRGKKKLKG